MSTIFRLLNKRHFLNSPEQGKTRPSRINRSNFLTITVINDIKFFWDYYFGSVPFSSASSSSSAWVFAATEHISNFSTGSPETVPTGMVVPPVAYCMGFNFPCCWRCPPGLWYELCCCLVRGSGSVGASSSFHLLPSFLSALIAAQLLSPPCPCLSLPC